MLEQRRRQCANIKPAWGQYNLVGWEKFKIVDVIYVIGRYMVLAANHIPVPPLLYTSWTIGENLPYKADRQQLLTVKVFLVKLAVTAFWLIRIDFGLSPGGTRFKSRSGRIFVIVVVHIQCSKLFKDLEYTELPIVLFTIKNFWIHSKEE